MQRGKADFWLMFTTLALVGLGVVMVFSASYYLGSTSSTHDPFRFCLKQSLLALLGIVLFFVFAHIPYHFYQKHMRTILIVSFLLLLAVLLPGVGVVRNGAQRWIQLGPLGFQPSELAKLGLLIYTATIMVRKQEVLNSFTRAALAPLVVIGAACALLILQPHFSAAVLLLASCCTVIFCAGLRWQHVLLLVALLVPVLVVVLLQEDYRVERLLGRLNPLQDPLGKGYQIMQSLLAIGSGGWTGVGLGHSIQKLAYLPESHTDFIFSVIAEELGMVGAIGVLSLFVCLIFLGIRTALRAPDLFGLLLALGIVALLAFEVLCNVGVATGVLPVTGTPLPLISYGRTMLVSKLIQLGILLNISRYQRSKKVDSGAALAGRPLDATPQL